MLTADDNKLQWMFYSNSLVELGKKQFQGLGFAFVQCVKETNHSAVFEMLDHVHEDLPKVLQGRRLKESFSLNLVGWENVANQVLFRPEQLGNKTPDNAHSIVSQGVINVAEELKENSLLAWLGEDMLREMERQHCLAHTRATGDPEKTSIGVLPVRKLALPRNPITGSLDKVALFRLDACTVSCGVRGEEVTKAFLLLRGGIRCYLQIFQLGFKRKKACVH
jgi:hypothetical protein